MGSAADPDGMVLHRQLYRWLPDQEFDRALIIGAGTGNDAVAGLYVLAYLFASRWRVLADRGLEGRRTTETELVARPAEP